MFLTAFQQDDGLIVYLITAGPEDGPVFGDEANTGQLFSCQMWGLISPTSEGTFSFTGDTYPEVSDTNFEGGPIGCVDNTLQQLAPFGTSTFTLEREGDRLHLGNDAGEQFTFEWVPPEPRETAPAAIPETTVPPTN